MEELYDAMVDLKVSIDKQTQVQEDLLAVMRALIGVTEENSQAIDDLKQQMAENGTTED